MRADRDDEEPQLAVELDPADEEQPRGEADGDVGSGADLEVQPDALVAEDDRGADAGGHRDARAGCRSWP